MGRITWRGDGSIHVKRNRQNLVYPAFEITLKYLNENENMLKLISEYIGGNIYYVKKNKSIFQVRWPPPYSSKDVKNCLRILSKYPLLTPRKICQLEYLLKCIEEKSWDYHLITRDKKYDYQMELINSENKKLVLPPYFKGWLSGFIEAEGCFRFRNNKAISEPPVPFFNRSMSGSI